MRILKNDSLIKILFFSLIIIITSCATNYDDLYKKYYLLPENPITKDAIHPNSQLEVGINAYFVQDYLGSKAALKPLIENDKSINLEAFYFYAHSFMATGDYDKAVIYFEAAQERLIGHISQPAEWYSALALMKKGDIDKSKKILKNIIAKANHKYYKDANDLLDALK